MFWCFLIVRIFDIDPREDDLLILIGWDPPSPSWSFAGGGGGRGGCQKHLLTHKPLWTPKHRIFKLYSAPGNIKNTIGCFWQLGALVCFLVYQTEFVRLSYCRQWQLFKYYISKTKFIAGSIISNIRNKIPNNLYTKADSKKKLTNFSFLNFSASYGTRIKDLHIFQ